MALRFCDSFNHYQTSDLIANGKWDGFSSNTSSLIISSGTGRLGGNSFRYSVTNVNQQYLFKTLDSQSGWTVGFAFRLLNSLTNAGSAGNPIVGLWDASTKQVDLRINQDGTLSITRNATALTNILTGTTRSAPVINTNAWNYIEWQMIISSGIGSNTCYVFLNGNSGNPVIALSGGQSTKNTSNSTANQIYLGDDISVGTPQLEYCDLYVNDNIGASPWNGPLGDVQVKYLQPTGISSYGNTAWSVSGAPSTIAAVSVQYASGDREYIYNTTAAQTSTFAEQSIPGNTTTVYGIQTVYQARKDNVNLTQIASNINISGVNYQGNINSLNTSYQDYLDVWMINPHTGQKWAIADFNKFLEVGVSGV